VRKGDDFTAFIVPKVEKIRSLNLPDSQGPAQACSGKPLPLSFTMYSQGEKEYCTHNKKKEGEQAW
jgi:hypothetical protein